MQYEDFYRQQAKKLEGIPPEFHTFLRTQAYDRGHTAGYEETLLVLDGLIFGLEEPIRSLIDRLGGEARTGPGSGADQSITIDEGSGYKVRVTLIVRATTQMVLVDWEHPNYGYFSDGGVFVRFAHAREGMDGWRCLATAAWMAEFEGGEMGWEHGAEDFVKRYPQARPLFSVPTPNPLVASLKPAAKSSTSVTSYTSTKDKGRSI